MNQIGNAPDLAPDGHARSRGEREIHHGALGARSGTRGDTLGNRYQSWWERTSDSYGRLATEARFGLRGTLNAALTPTGPLVSTIDFTLASPDKTLPEIAEAEALMGHSLLFAGDEILWAWGFTLVGANRYTAQLLRAQYGSLRVGHGVGDSVVLFFPTDDRPLKVHKMAFKEMVQRFKVQPWLFQLSRHLADCLPVSHAVQLRAYRPLAPLNLRVQGDGHCPRYATGQDIALTWDQSSPRRAVREPERDCPSHADHVIAEIWDAAGAAKMGELTFDDEAGGTIPNAELVAALGAESSFILKAYNQRGQFRSLACAQLAVTKVGALPPAVCPMSRTAPTSRKSAKTTSRSSPRKSSSASPPTTTAARPRSSARRPSGRMCWPSSGAMRWVGNGSAPWPARREPGGR